MGTRILPTTNPLYKRSIWNAGKQCSPCGLCANGKRLHPEAAGKQKAYFRTLASQWQSNGIVPESAKARCWILDASSYRARPSTCEALRVGHKRRTTNQIQRSVASKTTRTSVCMLCQDASKDISSLDNFIKNHLVLQLVVELCRECPSAGACQVWRVAQNS